MALSLGSSSGRGRRRSVGTLSEINVVPLVDVMLVLLIIFMLTAQVMEFGLEIDVPRSDSAKPPHRNCR
jgi:biopolymer transport protein ExbD